MSGKSESRTQWLYQSLPSKQQSRLKTGVASKEGMFGTILHLWPDLPGGIETHQRSTGELCLTQQRWLEELVVSIPLKNITVIGDHRKYGFPPEIKQGNGK